MKLLFLRKFSESDTKYLVDNLEKHYEIIPQEDDNENICNKIKEADVCIGLSITKEMIDNATNLKLIQVPGAGVNLLNLNLLQNTMIKVCNSHSNAIYVAEFGVSLLFTLLKKLHIHDNLMRQGYWYKPKNDPSDLLYQNDTLINKKIGIIGFGRIGQYIAKFLKPYDIEVLAYDKLINNLIYKDKVTKLELNDLLKKSDMIFVTIPLTNQTQNLLNKNNLYYMKPDSYLVNISRSEVLNKEDLYNTLNNKKIRGAAIDVWYNDITEQEGKKLPSDVFPFHKLENILLSPYRAGYFLNYSPHLYDVVENLKQFATTGKLINEIDIKLGY